MRQGGPPAHTASTARILELRDQDLSWTEVAEQVGMTRSGAWSRYRKARPSKSHYHGQRSATSRLGPERDTSARYVPVGEAEYVPS